MNLIESCFIFLSSVEHYSKWSPKTASRSSLPLWESENRSFTSSQYVHIQNTVNSKSFSVPQLILNHFMWITKLFSLDSNDESIAVKIVQSCKQFSPDLKKSMLQCVPLLCNNKADHDIIAEQMLHLVDQSDPLFATVLEILSSLRGVSQDIIMQQRLHICSKLHDCESNVVPSLGKNCFSFWLFSFLILQLYFSQVLPGECCQEL